MSAVHKLCSTKLNSDKMPSQIYSCLYMYKHTLSQRLILLFPCMHVTTCGCLLKTLFSNYGIIYHVANDWNDVLAFLL